VGRGDAMTGAAPSGVVTFLFTDVEGSTRRWEADAEGMRIALAAYDALLRNVIEAPGGVLFKHTGDGVCAAFSSPKSEGDGVAARYRPTRAARLRFGHCGFRTGCARRCYRPQRRRGRARRHYHVGDASDLIPFRRRPPTQSDCLRRDGPEARSRMTVTQTFHPVPGATVSGILGEPTPQREVHPSTSGLDLTQRSADIG
jgi:class 3 adenylate cyclase